MKRGLVTVLAIAFVAAPSLARDNLGVFDGWGAFRDATPMRCFAIAEPAQGSGGKWRPFASVGHWPVQKVRGQLHLRLSRERQATAKVYLTIDDRRWEMVAGKYDVWSPTSAHDAFIITKMRAGRSMSVSSVAATGGGFADTYKLSGAATAIDAAALGCAQNR